MRQSHSANRAGSEKCRTWGEDRLVEPDAVHDCLRWRLEPQHVQRLVPLRHDRPEERACVLGARVPKCEIAAVLELVLIPRRVNDERS